MFRNLFALFLFVFISGCAGRPTTEPLAASATSVVSAETPTPVATRTVRLSQVITQTPAATVLPPQADPRQRGTLTTTTGTATPRPTITRTPTVTIDTTITAIVTDLVATVTPEKTSFRSPDGKWRVDLLRYDCTQIVPGEWYESAYDLLQIVRQSDGATEPFADQLQYCGGLGAAGLAGIRWSPNSRYFYFTDAAEGVPDGGPLGWHRPTYQYDTLDGQILFVGGPFSPDGEKIVGAQYGADRCRPEVVAQTLDGEILAEYSLEGRGKDCLMTTFAWSPNSMELAYLESPCGNGGCVSTLYHVDLRTGERRAMVEDHSPSFQQVTWAEPDLLTLIDEQYKTWNYRISSGKLQEP